MKYDLFTNRFVYMFTNILDYKLITSLIMCSQTIFFNLNEPTRTKHESSSNEQAKFLTNKSRAQTTLKINKQNRVSVRLVYNPN